MTTLPLPANPTGPCRPVTHAELSERLGPEEAALAQAAYYREDGALVVECATDIAIYHGTAEEFAVEVLRELLADAPRAAEARIGG